MDVRLKVGSRENSLGRSEGANVDYSGEFSYKRGQRTGGIARRECENGVEREESLF